MEWSRQQDAALKAVDAWLEKQYSPVFRLFGHAGTGKTTLARHFAEHVTGNVLYGAYTGKAALRLREEGCLNASTIHRMIYNPKSKSRLRLRELEVMLTKTSDEKQIAKLNREIKLERERLAQPVFAVNEESDVRTARLIIIDEVSMVDGQIGGDLLSFGVPVLVLGDPAQLPPVRGTGFFIDAQPDVLLTDIHRQAKDNPIIRLATDVREGKRLALGDYGDSRVTCERLTSEEVLATDQILVGRNVTRHATNARVRQLKDISDPYPTVGEKLVCLRNDHDLGLLNGSLWNVEDIADADEESVFLSIASQYGEGETLDVEAWTHTLQGRDKYMDWTEKKEKQEFAYGYALTCHKSQGSQWKDVTVYDESHCFRANASKWLYTAITRASEKVTIVRK